MQRLVLSHWLKGLGLTVRRLRGARLLALSVVALGLSACGGSTAPHGYLCLLGRSVTDNGCYHAVTWATANASQ
jgi:hypothetical protein